MASRFETSSVEISAKGLSCVHHLHLQKMYSKIIPAECRVKMGKEGMQVRVIIAKLSDQEWKHLQI